MSEINRVYLKDYKEPEFNVKSVDLTFELFEEHTIVTNIMEIERVDESVEFLALDSIDLELISLKVDGKEFEFSYEDELLTISNLSKEFCLEIKNIIYPAKNTELEGLYQSGSIFCTQNEPEGFRRITPYLDRPDVMSRYRTTIIADATKYPVMLSNGNIEKNYMQLEDSRATITWYDPHPKPSYLFALVAGDLGSISDEFITASGNKVELNIYCDIGNESKCYHAMRSLKEAMIWDEEQYGREYDLDIYNIVAVDSFNMGAMENKGLNIFNTSAVLANSDVATDDNFMRIQSIIAHEYFHNWTGNRITCKNWFQLTLKEGLTVFRDQCFSADLNSKEVQRIDDVKALREFQFIEDASPTAHPIQPKSYISMNNFYTSTVYEKGAEVIRMIHTLIGEENYKKAMDLYFDTFDGKAVTTNDFLWAMSSASGHDLTQFRRWYDQSGTPTLELKESFSDGVYELHVKQKIPKSASGVEQRPYYFPFKIGLIDMSGKEILEKILIISQEEQLFSFNGLKEKPYLSVNRDFSAPIVVEQKESDYTFGMKYDQNSFARYDAMQSFAIETLESIMASGELNEKFVEAFEYVLDSQLDLSYKALLLELPSVSTLMQREEIIDFEDIDFAKEKLEKRLAERYEEKFLELYHENYKPTNSELDSRSIGERALANIALRYLSKLDKKEFIELAKKHYWDSSSMSNRVVALDIIENSSQWYSKDEIDDFYERYKNDTLVMNKYLSILALSKREGTLNRVIEVQDSEIYDIEVPNLVRALLGSFMRNSKFFHAKDGSGYEFIGDKLIQIDAINAQIASRLAGGFKLYKKMNPTNQEQMERVLKRVLEYDGISKNLYEIVSTIVG